MFYKFDFLVFELTKSHQTLLKTKQIHAFVTKIHLSGNPFYATKIIRFYALNNDLKSARYLFDKTPQRSVFLWNSIIRAFAQALKFDDAVSLFQSMLRTHLKPDNFTYACISRVCSESFNLDGLRLVHGAVTVSGLGPDSITSSALVTAYSKVGRIDDAMKVFDGVSDPDLVLFNSLISGYENCGISDKGLQLLNWMQRVGKKPDGYTIVGLISSIKESDLLIVGQGVHGFSLKSGLDLNDHVISALVSMYARFKCMDSAYIVFSSLFHHDLVTWSALITGYAQCGDYENALFFFRKLFMEGKKADIVMIASILSAAAQSSNIWSGSVIHGYVIQCGFESSIMVSSALIDMYSKCGFMGLAMRVFKLMPERNIVTYNSVILGLGLHGFTSDAFEMFNEMIDRGLKPDESTFSALLCACSHGGLVYEGREVFRRMTEEFGIQARTEHYVYMVKIQGMIGNLEEVYQFVWSLPKPIDSGIWGALLSCCEIHGNSELAEVVAKQLFENHPRKGVYRVMLSNVYAGYGRWDDVKNLRDETVDGRLQKLPALSCMVGINDYSSN